MAEGVEELLRCLGERSVHVVGLSMGGCVALALAIRAQSLVRSLVLVNSFARYRPSGVAAVKTALRVAMIAAGPKRVVASAAARGLFPEPEQRDLYWSVFERLRRT